MLGNFFHPTAIISQNAIIGKNVKIGAFSIIEDNVEIGDNSEIRSSVVIANGTRIGKDCLVHSSTVIGTEPQDLKFRGESTFVFIGDRTKIHQFVTIHRGTGEMGKTIIGNDCLIMAYCHVAHDCTIGNYTILSNATTLSGHVEVEDWVVFGGFAKIIQFCRVGCHAFIGGDVKLVKDVAPYTLIGRNPPKVEGINKIGLSRRNFTPEIINEINEFYKTIFFSGFNISNGIAKFMEREKFSQEIKHCIDFIHNSKLGVYR
jgi:UDP-N-acetylglucosamine acyltransferase